MRRIFVGNIPHAASESELQEWIEAYGFVVESAEIMRDRSTGQPRGFGFVSLREAGKVKQAIAELNGKRMNGRILTVNEAVPLRPPADPPSQQLLKKTS